MAGTPIPWIAQQFLDNAGKPCAGGKLASFLAGTTSPTPLFSDVGLTVPYPNPLILDSSGRPPGTPMVFAAPTSYKFELRTSANVLVWIVDNIPATPASEIDLDVQLTAGEALSARDAVFLADGTGGTIAGRVYKTDADIVARSTGANIIGIAPAAIASGATGAIRLQGRVTGFSGLTPGANYYVSAVAGEITAAAPANTRFIGIADTTTSFVLTVSGTAAALPANAVFQTVQITSNAANALSVTGGIEAGAAGHFIADGGAFALQLRGRASDNIGIIRFLSNDGSVEYGRVHAQAALVRLYDITRNQALDLDANGFTFVGGPVNVAASLHVTGAISPPALAADQNDYNPAGLSTTTRIRLSTSGGARSLTGLQAQSDGRVLIIQNLGPNLISFVYESASSAAANRFIGGTAGLSVGESRMFVYDAIASRWSTT